jgi:hypothetical protein
MVIRSDNSRPSNIRVAISAYPLTKVTYVSARTIEDE